MNLSAIVLVCLVVVLYVVGPYQMEATKDVYGRFFWAHPSYQVKYHAPSEPGNSRHNNEPVKQLDTLACMARLDQRIALSEIPMSIKVFINDILKAARLQHSTKSLYELATQTDGVEFKNWVANVRRPQECDQYEMYFDQIPCLRSTLVSSNDSRYASIVQSIGKLSELDRSIGSLWACRTSRTFSSQPKNWSPSTGWNGANYGPPRSVDNGFNFKGGFGGGYKGKSTGLGQNYDPPSSVDYGFDFKGGFGGGSKG